MDEELQLENALFPHLDDPSCDESDYLPDYEEGLEEEEEEED